MNRFLRKNNGKNLLIYQRTSWATHALQVSATPPPLVLSLFPIKKFPVEAVPSLATTQLLYRLHTKFLILFFKFINLGGEPFGVVDLLLYSKIFWNLVKNV